MASANDVHIHHTDSGVRVDLRRRDDDEDAVADTSGSLNAAPSGTGPFHTQPMVVDINGLRRRPDGARLLIALDQSTLSELALNEAHAATRDLLVSATGGGEARVSDVAWRQR